MKNLSTASSHRRFWRSAFLLLVALPFLPELLIGVTAVLAKMMGCQPDQDKECLIGLLSASDVIAFALRVGAGLIVAATSNGVFWFVAFCIVVTTWLILCYIALTLGWARTPIRLVLGVAVALVFAVMPYFGPMLAIANLVNDKCQPNEGAIGACLMFGGYVGAAHQAVQVGWLILAGAPIALAAFVIYAIFAIVVRVGSAKRVVRSAR